MNLQFDLLIHAANVLYLFAFMVRDILWLRILTVVAAFCLVPYFYFRPEPLMPPIYWNLAFTSLNIFWIVRLLLERRHDPLRNRTVRALVRQGFKPGRYAARRLA